MEQDNTLTVDGDDLHVHNHVLRDGRIVEIRMIRPEDKALLEVGLSELSAKSRYYRFFRDLNHLSQSELKYLTEVDHQRHCAWGAVMKAVAREPWTDKNNKPEPEPERIDSMLNPKYGLSKVLDGVDYVDAVERVTAALKNEGFGVLTEIDVRATLKQKLDVDFRRYIILGACNPSLAHQSLQAEPAIGLLLPCNVVVAETNEGGSVVSIAKPSEMFKIVDNPDMDPIVQQVEEKLVCVLASL